MSIPLLLVNQINGCYLNNLKIGCTNVKGTSSWEVEGKGLDLSSGGNLVIQVITYPYSISIDDSIYVVTKLPKAVSSIPLSVTLAPKPLLANFSSTSLSVSVKSNYTLSLSLLNISSLS